MGKFSTRQGPLVETIDRRGAALDKGIGNAPVSEALAALDGAERGANLAGKILDNKNRYNPRRLEAEITGLELGNDSVRESVRGAALTNDLVEKYGDRETSANVRILENKAEVAEKTGLRNAESVISNRNASTANTRQRTSSLAFQNTAEQRTLRTRIAQAKADSDEFYSKPGVLEADFKRQQLANQTAEEKLFELAKINMGLGNQDAGKAAEKSAKALRAQEAAWQDNANKLMRLETGGASTEVIGEAKTILENSRKKLDELRTASVAQQTHMRNNSTETQRAELAQDNTQRLMKGTQVATEAQRSVLANKLMDMAVEASSDNPTGVDGPNLTSGASVLDQQVKLMKKARSETEKKMLAGQIESTIEMFGGKEAFDDYINSDSISDDDKKALSKTLARATVASGNTKYLSTDQKTMLEAGSGLKAIEDPEEAKAQVAASFSGSEESIKDLDLRKAVRNNLYYTAASNITNKGEHGFKTEHVIVEAAKGPTGADIQGAQSADEVKALVFVNDKGQRSKNLPMPQSDQDHAKLNFVQSIGEVHAKSVEANKQAQDSSAVIDQNNQPAVPQPVQEAQSEVATDDTPEEAPEVQEASNFILGRLDLPGEATPKLKELTLNLGKAMADGEVNDGLIFNKDTKLKQEAVDEYIKMSFDALSDEEKKILEGEALERTSFGRNVQTNSPSSLSVFETLGGDNSIRAQAEKAIDDASKDVMNNARLKNNIKRAELVAAANNSTNFVKQLAAQKKLERFDRVNKNLLLTDDQRVELKRLGDLAVRGYQLKNNALPNERQREELKLDIMRNMFDSADPSIRSILNDDDVS